MRYLVTGAARGLGLAMHNKFGGVAFVRGTPLVVPDAPYDAIIHCAVNTAKVVHLEDAHAYFQDNVLLTQQMLRIPHRRFIYISSVDVYSSRQSPACAGENYEASPHVGLYAATKIFSESMVKAQGRHPLILRPTTLMGPGMRPNSTLRMLTERDCRLFISGASRFNFVLHGDVCDFVGMALRDDVEGIFNIASASNVEIGAVAQRLGLSPTFGEHVYDVGLIDQAPAAKLHPAFARTSSETLNAFIDQIGARYAGRGRLEAEAA